MNVTAEKVANTQANGKKKRVQLQHLVLDCDFFQKPKVIALQYKFGSPGICALIDCLCMMSKGTDGEIPTDCALALACKFDLPDPQAFIDYCLSLGIFQPGSSALYISNSRVVADQESMAAKQDEWRNKKRQQREPQGTLGGQQGDNAGTNTGPVNTEDLKNEDLKNEKELVPPAVAAAIERWRRYLKEKYNRVFDQIAEEAVCCEYYGRHDELIRNINWSVASAKWQTIQIAPEKPLPEAERIRIASEAKAKALAPPPEPPRPKPKKWVPPWESETKDAAKRVTETKEDIHDIVTKSLGVGNEKALLSPGNAEAKP